MLQLVIVFWLFFASNFSTVRCAFATADHHRTDTNITTGYPSAIQRSGVYVHVALLLLLLHFCIASMKSIIIIAAPKANQPVGWSMLYVRGSKHDEIV